MKTCWPTSGNSTSGSRRTHPSITTGDMDSVEIAIPTAGDMADIATNQPHRPEAHPRRLQLEVRVEAQQITVRSTPSTMAPIRTLRMVAIRITSLTTNTTSKWPSSSSNSLKKLLLPRHLHPVKLLHLHLLVRDLLGVDTVL